MATALDLNRMLRDRPASISQGEAGVALSGNPTDRWMNKRFEPTNLVGHRLSGKEDFGHFGVAADVLHELTKLP